MVNVIEETPVQLTGRGLVHSANDSYVPGDYGALENVDISRQGSLVSRLPVRGCTHLSGVETIQGHFIGHKRSVPLMHDSSLIGSPTIVSEAGPGTAITALSTGWTTFQNNVLAVRPTSGTDGGYTDAVVTLLGFFSYGLVECTVTQVTYRPNGTNNSVAYLVVTQATAGTGPNDLPVSWALHAVGTVIFSVTETNLYTNKGTYYNSNERYSQFLATKWIIHKDRLWITTYDTVYFSEAGNPINFTAPLGGFFRFPESNLKSIVAYADAIYIIGDSSCRMLSYASDPNLDSEVNLISDRIGGEDATLLGDIVYTVKPNAIYAIQGLNVTKVADLNLGLNDTRSLKLLYNGTPFWGCGNFGMKLESYEDSLYIIYRLALPRGDASPYNLFYSKEYLPGNNAFDVPSVLYKFNTELGYLTSYSFGTNGAAVDSFFVPVEDKFNQTKLYFLGNKLGGAASDETYRLFSLGSRHSHPSASFVYPVGRLGMDTVYTASPTTLVAEQPLYVAHILNFAPDGSRFKYKKIRTIEMALGGGMRYSEANGTLSRHLSLFVGFRDSYPSSVSDSVSPSLLSTLSAEATANAQLNIYENSIYLEPLRLGINQRCRRMHIVLNCATRTYTTLNNAAVPVSAWEIPNINVLWSPTTRSSVNNTQGS